MFTRDDTKAATNAVKHDVTFEEAATIFDDSNGLDWEDSEHSFVEERRKRLGKSKTQRILIAVYTVRRNNDKETIRIISARQASSKERETYAGL